MLTTLVALSNFALPTNIEKYRGTFEHPVVLKTDAPTARTGAVPLSKLSFDSIPEAPLSEIRRVFVKIRDTGLVADPEHPGILRRATWLYANDGCFVRATLGAELLEKTEPKLFRRLKKVWVFGGGIRAASEWASREWADNTLPWVYHVALVMKAREDHLARVIDPALDETGPLTFAEWRSRFVTQPGQAAWNVCSPYTFGPNEECAATAWPAESGGVTLDDWKSFFLTPEWENVADRGLAPEDTLGAHPLWSWPAIDTRPWRLEILKQPLELAPGQTVTISRPGARWVRVHLSKRTPDSAGALVPKGQPEAYGDLIHSYGSIERTWTHPIPGGEVDVSVTSGSVRIERIETVR